MLNVRAYPYLAAGDGVTDDTAAIQKAASAGSPYFPPGTYLISGALQATANQRWVLAPGATILAAPTMFSRPLLIIGAGVQNVDIMGGVFDGGRTTNPTGQLIGIRLDSSCRNVKVSGVQIRNVPADSTGGSWGDGIYLGTNTTGLVPQDVWIEDCVIDGCVRNCITVAGGQRIHIRGNSLLNAAGNSPGAGLDIEPNSTANLCSDVVVIGNTAVNVFHGLRATGAACTRVVFADNTLSGQGTTTVDASGNPSYGIYTAPTATNICVANNVVVDFNENTSLHNPL